jgi:hypothetical protein
VKGLELVCNNLVCAFEDPICLGIGCSHDYYFDTVGLKEFLKLNSGS